MAPHFARTVLVSLTAFALFAGVSAQTRRKPAGRKVSAPVVTQPTPLPEPVATPVPDAPKRNARPNSTAPVDVVSDRSASRARYRYEFTQPGFLVSRVIIEHDDAGHGHITFRRRDSEEEFTDPIVLSAVTLERIKGAYAALNFLDSNEDYQYEKDYSHLGNAVFTLNAGAKTRTAKFNFTQNKDAKILSDEYRKLGYQYVWIFDITVARENQPLEAPRLLDSLDRLIRRNEISDPPQMKGLLTSLADDERIPLIARNHATRLIKFIEKQKK